MSHDVCTSVRAIMASFVDGFAVTTSLRNTHKKRRKHDAHSNDRKATNALSKSLQQSPRIIGEEYENALRHAGPQFAQGDGRQSTVHSLSSLLTISYRHRKHKAE